MSKSKSLTFSLVLLGVVLGALASPSEYEEFEIKPAEPCSPEKCKLPDCRCSGLDLPSPEFEGKENTIPQFVTLTFDDAVNVQNFHYYEDLFKDLVNSDKCPATAAFYVSHEWTDYTQVNWLYNHNHEIGLHSISHSTAQNYWRDASVDTLLKEFGQQFEMFHRFAKVHPKSIKGLRMPFLQMAGNNTFIAAKRLGLLYETSMPTLKFYSPPMWPYTLDYASTQDCHIGPCVDVSVPGLWEFPMVMWKDVNDYNCAMLDGCHIPSDYTADQVFEWMLKNFKRYYESNRAPFNLFTHASWFGQGDHIFQGLKKFLKHVTTLPNVYITTPSRVIEWMKNPVPNKPYETCLKRQKLSCKKVFCKAQKMATNEVRYLSVCGRCPEVYPWIDNPYGLAHP